MKRRAFLTAAAATPAGLLSAPAASYDELPNDVDHGEGRPLSLINARQEKRDDRMLDIIAVKIAGDGIGEPREGGADVTLSKENALPYDLWGLIYKDWQPTPEEGVTVFLQGLDERGENNLRKRIYFSALTPDLCVHR